MVKQVPLVAMVYAVTPAQFRATAHKIADVIYEKMTGDPGVFSTRIAYITKQGTRFQLLVADADGFEPQTIVTSNEPMLTPRWAPDGRRIAFVSRRRGWSQVWIQDANLPHRGRPPTRPVAPEARAITPVGVDVDAIAWSPDGSRLAITAQRQPDLLTNQVTILDLASGEERTIAGAAEWATGARWLPDGSGVLLVSDADGWFQVVRIDSDGTGRTALTSGAVEHGAPGALFGIAPIPSPDGTRFVHAVVRDGLRAFLQIVDGFLVVGEATTGREAVDLACKLHPSVIVMDVAMPRLNGCEATRQILLDNPSARVLALSARSDDEYVARMVAAGAMGFLEKQSSGEVLLRAIREVSEGRNFFSAAITRRVSTWWAPGWKRPP